jgi:hypothetical protein
VVGCTLVLHATRRLRTFEPFFSPKLEQANEKQQNHDFRKQFCLACDLLHTSPKIELTLQNQALVDIFIASKHAN